MFTYQNEIGLQSHTYMYSVCFSLYLAHLKYLAANSLTLVMSCRTCTQTKTKLSFIFDIQIEFKS